MVFQRPMFSLLGTGLPPRRTDKVRQNLLMPEVLALRLELFGGLTDILTDDFTARVFRLKTYPLRDTRKGSRASLRNAVIP